ncbi:complex I NDUFA9 subunit family protein [Mariprofundus sp. EBB-1]|uniref:complex I NDUFA9 subunit family protein n=1 Tax=Mariprofundus sp. EBB-1 TaxID=2650971 RepID=UPI000EF1FA05|nr:complex I NDUFA9 subunit family protein [Mariprofundus sp. EBB-1]RLL51549.1 complex I NDUFA9 subunit family protein [Mariprofundus sp. EBB-1]
MGKRVCIIGGSGFVGRSIVDQAIAAGHQVSVACRHPERARDLLIKGVKLHAVDVTDGRGMDTALKNQDVVIYLVGLLFEKGRQNFASAHVDGVARTITACKQAGIKQYIHMSALGAGDVIESSYASTKGEAESLVRDSGLNWTIFRPSIIYGAGDNFFNKFKAMSALLPIMPVISGSSLFQPIWVEDVARAFVCSIGNKHVSGQRYDLGGPKAYSFQAMLELLMNTLDRNRLLIPVPGFAAKLMATFTGILPTPPITLDQLKLLSHDNTIDGEAFPTQFGTASALEQILPSYIGQSQAEELQQRLDSSRQHYRKGGI